ncbi:MAG: hypothetical protein NUV59_03345, partial [Patescibacteria group bacterium]|nr:hypothetical protein [Patescibacteria group bacterium]
SCSFNGQTITNGQSVTAYQSSTVPYGSSCTSQTRTCSNGSLSGSYQYSSCSVNPPTSCTLDGVTVPHGSSHTFYTQQAAPSGSLCSSYAQSRTCTNGTLSGSSSYLYASCSCTTSYSCTDSQHIQYTNPQCQTSPYATCTSPAFCTEGSAACLYPPPVFIQSGGDLTGHLQATPQIVPTGLPTTITWNVDNVSDCTVSGDNGDGWSGTSGSHSSSPILQQTIFTLHCDPLDGSTLNESVVVNVLPIFQEI